MKVVCFKGPMLPDVAKGLAFSVRSISPTSTAFIAATVDPAGKPLLTVMFTEDLAKNGHNASQLVREAAKKIKGGGGGQPGFAQAGGKDADGLAEAFNFMVESVK